MKNRKPKKKIRWYWNLGGVLFLIAFIGFLGILYFPSEPHFKITKEECWNETGIIGYKEFNFMSNWTNMLPNIIGTVDSYFPEDTDCNRLYKNNFNNNKRLVNCSYILRNISCYTPTHNVKLYDNSTQIISTREHCKYKYLILSNMEITKEKNICEQVEVDEDESLCWIFEENLGLSLCKDWEYESMMDIEKIDTSIEWLEENCECIRRVYINEDPCTKLNKIKKDCDYTRTCSKYKCGDSLVEVENDK